MMLDQFLRQVPDERREAFLKLRQEIITHLPKGFVETVGNSFIHYQVPLDLYPQGYHVGKDTPLPFLSLASQKNGISLYHMGLYMDKDLENWFKEAYQSQVPTKLDMGKSCVRLKNPKHIPFALIGELASRLTVSDYIALYEKTHLKNQNQQS